MGAAGRVLALRCAVHNRCLPTPALSSRSHRRTQKPEQRAGLWELGEASRQGRPWGSRGSHSQAAGGGSRPLKISCHGLQFLVFPFPEVYFVSLKFRGWFFCQNRSSRQQVRGVGSKPPSWHELGRDFVVGPEQGPSLCSADRPPSPPQTPPAARAVLTAKPLVNGNLGDSPRPILLGPVAEGVL